MKETDNTQRDDKVCCLCGHKLTGEEFSPWPLIKGNREAKCCKECFNGKVVPAQNERYCC